MPTTPAVPAHRYQCTTCELSMNAPRCVCGGRGIRFVDRRPVLLSDALRELVESSLAEALREARTTCDSSRARLLRALVLPHFLAVLKEHDRASRRRRRGLSGYRTLSGSIPSQLQLVSRMPMRGLRPSEKKAP